MIPIALTERTITHRWNKATQTEEEVIADTAVYVNPEQIVFVRGGSDAPEKYASHIRTVGNWDLFVLEQPEEIRRLARWAVSQEGTQNS